MGTLKSDHEELTSTSPGISQPLRESRSSEVPVCSGSCQAVEEARSVSWSLGCQSPLLVWSQSDHGRKTFQRFQKGSGLSQEGSQNCEAVHGSSGPGSAVCGDPEPLCVVL